MTVRAGGCEHSIRETLYEIDEWDRVQQWSTVTIDDLREKTDYVKAAFAHDPAFHSPGDVLHLDKHINTEPETFKSVLLTCVHHELEHCDCRCEACKQIQVNTPSRGKPPFAMDHPTTVPKHPPCQVRPPMSVDEPQGSGAEITTADESMPTSDLHYSCDDASIFITDNTDEIEEKIEEHDIETFDYAPPEEMGHTPVFEDGQSMTPSGSFTMGEVTVDAGDLITDAIEEHARQSAKRAQEIAEAMDDADHHIEFDMTATGEERPERRSGDADRLEGDDAPESELEPPEPVPTGAAKPVEHEDGEAPTVRMGQPDLDPLGDDEFWG